MRFSIVVFSLFICCISSNGQVTDSLVLNYDSLTYSNFINEEWSELIDNSTAAIETGYGTVGIRKRLGYSYFELKKYLQSIGVYESIYKQNKTDQDALVMLYRSYSELGMKEEANYYLGIINSETKQQLKLREDHFMVGADIHSGISLNDNFSKNKNKDIRQGGVYGEQSLNGELYYLQGGILIAPKRWLNLYFSFQDVQMKKMECISATDLKLTGTVSDFFNGIKYERNLYALSDTTYRTNSFVNQRLGYIQGSFILPALFTFRIYGNYLMNEYSVARSSYRFENYFAQPIDNSNSTKTVYSFTDSVQKKYEYIVGAVVEKRVGLFEINIGGTYSNLNSKIQAQSRAGFKWFPNGNTSIVTGGQLSYFYEEKLGRLLPEVFCTIRLLKNGWFTLSGMLGDLTNTSEYNGLVVHNSTDKTVYRISSSVYWNILSHFNLTVAFHYSQKQSNFITYPQADRYFLTETPYSAFLTAIGLTYTL